ncbi:MAG: RHS repeat-associated core domain-containing protein, partial [Mycobacterium sp.]|nr:RHS repeat-associated core domain-containing protein [Mycobacterium sp.]
TVTQTSALTVSATSPSSGGNAGNVTIEIDGTNFTPSTTAGLTLGGTTLSASAIDFVSASQLYATFNLAGTATGGYTLSLKQGNASVSAPGTFSVSAAVPGSLNFVLGTPQYVRSGRTGSIVISYTNPTNNDIPAPLLSVASTNANVLFSTSDAPNSFVSTAQVLAVASSGPAGILRPGQSGQLTLTILSNDMVNNDSIPVQVGQIASGQTINWASQQAALEPPNIPASAWNVIFANLLGTIGSTTTSYATALDQAATYLGGLGETAAQVSDLNRLWSFLIAQANASFPSSTLTSAVDASLSTPGSLPLAVNRTFVSSISGRDTPGLFGLGWVTSWQTSLSVDASGNVTIDSGGTLGLFTKQANGTYLDTNGAYGALTQAGGIYTFTNTSGTQNVFLANGQLNYEQDTNGNRITLGYNAGRQLVSLTYSNPSDPSEPTEQLTLSYNGQGFVSQVADGTGDTWSYQYDAAGHLLSVVAPGNLTTSYTYDTSSNPDKVNSLLSITNPNGSLQSFTYDAQGRLAGTSQNGGANAISYTYDGQAEVTATDAGGNHSTIWYNELGLASRVQDALGNTSQYLYDNNGNLVSYTDAAGGTYQYAFNTNGNLTQIVNPLGQTVRMAYGALSNLTSITDAAGNTTQYNYGPTGNLLSIAYPDGTSQSFSYDPLGNLSETVKQNGHAVSAQNNAQGLLASETFADGTSETFAYDAHGNLLTAQTFATNGTLTGTTTLTYNTANELTSIAYPGSLSLTFTYNAQGQRTQSIDQTGFTVNYSYDALGRLSKLTDGSGNSIVQYTYNNIGELVKKQNGNGTSTTYAYDAAGNLTQEVDYAPDGSTVNSSFTYTYNALGAMTSMTDASGATTSYGYDATGQLTSVTLPGGQTTTYVYNAAGDRTEVISGGTTTIYASNVDNEITQVGSATYTYDANGNLASVTDAGGTTTYTYNDVNELISITAPGGTTTTFQYSPLGFLVGENVGGTQTTYLVDPTGAGNTVASYNGAGSLIADYTYGLGLVSQTGPSGSGYYDFNASGNTVGITGAGGAYVNQYSYLPFGETTVMSAALPNPFTFAGQVGVMQIGTNLFSMRERNYTPTTGQFLSNDPIGLAGGDPNVRRYVGNSPNTQTDPQGLEPPPLFGTYAAALNAFNASGGAVQGAGAAARTAVSRAAAAAFSADAVAIVAAFGAGWFVGDLAAKSPLGTLARNTYGRAAQKAWVPAINGAFKDPGVQNFFMSPGGKALGGVIKNALSEDPNALIGPAGYGTQGFIGLANTLPYTVDFENDGSA